MEYTTQAAEIVLDENQPLKAVAKKKLKKKPKTKMVWAFLHAASTNCYHNCKKAITCVLRFSPTI